MPVAAEQVCGLLKVYIHVLDDKKRIPGIAGPGGRL
jgi:hypothetical protein